MADNNHAVIKIRTDQSENAIEDINHNFRVLTERIKDLNLTISYMDLLRLQEVYQVNLEQETSVRLQNFVSNCWGKLPNYSGVAFSTTGTETADPLFTFLGYQVKTRDFLVKLPDDQCLYIQGVESKVFKPSYANNTLSYELVNVDEAGSVGDISLNPNPMVAAGAMFCQEYSNVAPNGLVSAPPGYTVFETRWYTANDEEVLWTGSHYGTRNMTSMTLNAVTFYKRLV